MDIQIAKNAGVIADQNRDDQTHQQTQPDREHALEANIAWVTRDIIDPLEKDGLFLELRTVEDDRFIGYTLTDSGRKVFLAE